MDLVTLADDLAPVTVAASHTLTDGTTFTFDATYQRQRPALLLQDGSDLCGLRQLLRFRGQPFARLGARLARRNLKPLPNSELNDTQASSPTDFFLSSVWMSGFGLATNGRTLFLHR